MNVEILLYFFYSEEVSSAERCQVLSVNWSVLSPEGVLTLLELTCRMFAKVSNSDYNFTSVTYD